MKITNYTIRCGAMKCITGYSGVEVEVGQYDMVGSRREESEKRYIHIDYELKNNSI